jgi:hypothetical protein
MLARLNAVLASIAARLRLAVRPLINGPFRDAIAGCSLSIRATSLLAHLITGSLTEHLSFIEKYRRADARELFRFQYLAHAPPAISSR